MIIYWLRHRGTFFPVHQGDCLLGRSPECLIILASEQVSREHAVVRRIHCGLEIEDLGSRNGTWVNGERIRRPTVLSPDDRIQLGEDVLEVVLKPNARAPDTVSNVEATLGQESERQRRALERLEYAADQLSDVADPSAAALGLHQEIERLVGGSPEGGVLLSPEEMRRLAALAGRVAQWSADREVVRWSAELGERLARRLPSAE